MVVADEREIEVWNREFEPCLWFASKQKMAIEDKPHSHADFTEMSFILSGKGEYVVNGCSYEVSAGDLLICNKGDVHQNFILNKDAPTVEYIIGFSHYRFIGMPPEQITLPSGSNVFRMNTEAKREVTKLCYEMIAESEAGKIGKSIMMRSYLVRLLMIVMRELITPQEEQTVGYHFETYRKSYVVKQIMNYLSDNYNRKISLEQIAKNMYLSPVYISKIFKEETGESPISHLIQIRLAKACEMLLAKTAGSIKNIANEVGYEDVYHFSKLFKKYYGVSPQNYRKNKMR